MAPKPKSAAEAEEEIQQEQQHVEEKVDSAGEKAKDKAEAQGLSEDEVNKRVEAARKAEKDKLYPKIEDLSNALKDVQDELRKEREDKEAEKRKQEKDAEEARQAQLSDQDRQNETLQRIEEQLNKERAERLAKDKLYEKKEKAAQLKEYRNNAIQAVRDSGEELLPELVQGSTEEEIDASIETAKARYTELADKFKAELGDKTKRTMPRSTSPDTEALEEEELNETLAQVDRDKYMSDPDYRERIVRELEGAYQRAQGLQ